MNLTDLTIKKLAPPEKGQKDYFDDAMHGFSVRVSQGGTKTFALLHGTPRRRTTIGRYGIITLAEARAEARRILAEETLTKHRPTRLKATDALTAFLDSHVAINNRTSTQQSTTRRLNTHLLPRVQGKMLEDIAPADITKIIDGIMAKGTHSEANHAYVAMRTFFNWCVKRHYLTASPCKGGMPAQSTPRERTLHPSELKAIYNACGTDPFGASTRLMVLTGQRRGEIAHITHENLVATILATYTKNGRAHSFPITTRIAELLSFDRTFNGWGKAKARLDKLSGVSDWTLHDLRRTYATVLAELGTAPHVIEKLLNHATGTISGVAAIYNKHRYFDEMKKAVEDFEHWFRGLLDDPCV